jgi:hypothetical protein
LFPQAVAANASPVSAVDGGIVVRAGESEGMGQVDALSERAPVALLEREAEGLVKARKDSEETEGSSFAPPLESPSKANTGQSSPSPGTPGGAFLGSSFMRTCSNCDEQIAATGCCQWGKGFSWHICKTNCNRNNERCKCNPTLRSWWKALSKEERTQWFRRNKTTY